MLKVGGKLSYSTCSLNPIEDESVVASALKHFQGCIQLEKVSLPGFKFRQGLTHWKVMTERNEEAPYFMELDKYESVPEEYRKRTLKESMFPGYYDQHILDQLSDCLRVFPHDQNTSGFFITIIRKTKDFDANTANTELEEAKEERKSGEERQMKAQLPLEIQRKDNLHSFAFTRCESRDPDIEYLQAYYGLSADFPAD